MAKGTPLNEEKVAGLQGAAIEEVRIGPATPADIQCAQLCGLGHYRMRGQLKVLEPAAFEEWYATAGVVEEFTEDDFDD